MQKRELKNINNLVMKKLLTLLLLFFISLTAFADWTYGTASFRGKQPSKCLCIGGVQVWYNGILV